MSEDKAQDTEAGYRTDFSHNRRDFLKAAGGGIVVLFTAGVLPSQERASRRNAGTDLPPDFNAFLRIGVDGRVSLYTGKIEMGQGIVTSLAQTLADELDVAVERGQYGHGRYGSLSLGMGTFGSRSTRFFGPPRREAAAEARKVLIAMASERLGVPQNRLVVNDGVISDRKAGGKKITYAQLARGKPIARHLPAKPAVKKVSEFKVMGRPYRRTDGLKKVTGSALYAADVRLPGMLSARILRPPVHGARLLKVDTCAARNYAGAVVVEEGDLVAVLHALPDVAEKALFLVKAEYDTPESRLDNSTIHDHLLARAPREGETVSESCHLAAGRNLAVATFAGTYCDHYVAHAAMETHAALAKVQGDKAIVWPSTQTPFPAKDSIAGALGVPARNMHVIMPFVGGGFEGKSYHRQAIEAARLAKATGKPVQVMWSRHEEFFYDTFRPASIVKVQSGLDKAGKIVFWQYDVYYAGPRGAEQFYDIPHHREIAYVHYTGQAGERPFATGPWRASGNNSNTFARESQIDAMAAVIKKDPLAFRTAHLADGRMRNALKAVGAKFGGEAAPAPSGQGWGMACSMDAGHAWPPWRK